MKNGKIKCRVFIGSSKESESFVRILAKSLRKNNELKIWYENVFMPGSNTYTNLIDTINNCDFAILLLSADDIAESRGVDYFAPRDNIVFESGIAFGLLSPRRTFIVPEVVSGLKVPTDLSGFTICDGFEAATPSPGLEAAARQIRDQMKALGRRRGSHSGESKEGLIDRTNVLLRSASRHITMVGRDLTWIDDYGIEISQAVARNVNVSIYGQYPINAEWRARLEKIKAMGVSVRCSKKDLGMRFTIVDHDDVSSSEFIICSKERCGDDLVYRFEHHAFAGSPVIWNALNRFVGIFPHLSSPM